MKSRVLSSFSILVLVVLLAFLLYIPVKILVLPKPSLWHTVEEHLHEDNPIWKPNTEIYRESGATRDEKGISIMLAGPGLDNLSSISGYKINYLVLLDVNVRDLSFLENSKNLKVLSITGSPELRELSAIEGKKIVILGLIKVPVKDLAFTKGMPLQRISINSPVLSDISALSDKKNLKWVSFQGCRDLTDISALSKLPALRCLELKNSAVENLSPLEGKSLEYLNISGTPVANKPLPKGLKVKKLFR